MYEVERVQRFEALEPLREAWDRLVAETSGYVHLTFDWCRVWWRHYGQGRELRVFLVREAGRLVAVVPMFVERAWLGPVWIRRAKLLASDHTFAICDPPVREDCAGSVFREVLAQLMEEGCDEVRFGRLSGASPVTAAIREAAGAPGPWRMSEDREVARLTLFDLPESFDAYLGALKKEHRKSARRRRRLLEQEHEGVVADAVRSADELASEFARFEALHEEQWRREGKLGHFGDWPDASAFNRELALELARLGRTRLYRIAVADRVIQYRYAFLFEGVLSAVLPARDPSQEWQRYSLGRIGLVAMLEEAIAEGARHVEAGPGYYEYKLSLGGHQRELRAIAVVSTRPGAALRARAYRKLAELLDLFYYRGYFLKVAPALPWRPSPLWRSWIRSRP